MNEQDNQPDGFKTESEPDAFQALLERCYRTQQQPQESLNAAMDFTTGLAGDE